MKNSTNLLENCNDCNLCNVRKQVVPGIGNVFSSIMFIGEAPGTDEDEQGLPFVGRSGKLVNKLFEFIGLDRKWIYITNVVKCVPKDNKEEKHSRTPTMEEINCCFHFLESEIVMLKPLYIVTFGRIATEVVVGKPVSITNVNSKFQELNQTICEKMSINYNRIVFPIVHPSYVLRNSQLGKPLFLKAGNVLKTELEHTNNKEIPF